MALQHLSISVLALFSGGAADIKQEPWSLDKFLEALLGRRALPAYLEQQK